MADRPAVPHPHEHACAQTRGARGASEGPSAEAPVHGHSHGGGHSHDHAAGAGRRRLAIAFAITSSILLAEVIGAVITGSLALLVDAAHMLVDAGGLLLALLAASLATRPSSSHRTWGWLRAEILAAGMQAAVLLAVGIYAIVEGIRRLLDPPPAADTDVALLAVIGAVGLAANIASLLVLAGGRGDSMNMRAAFLEVLNDALGSVAVIAAAAVIHITGWTGADALAGLLISLLILPRALVLLRESGSVLLESAPRGLDVAEAREHLETVPHVVAIHDLHASVVATGVPVLTAHVVVDDDCFHDGSLPSVLDALQLCAVEHLPVAVEHTTFQLEPASHRRHEALGPAHG